MASTIEICNLALGYVGEPPIASFDDRRPAAEYCKLYYDGALRALLREHPWNFATDREYLTPVDVPEAWQPTYTHAYVLPARCLHLQRLIDQHGNQSLSFTSAAHPAQGRDIILCRIPSAIAEFTRYVDNANAYGPFFIQALARKLQSMIARSLLKNSSGASQIIQEAETLYRQELESAKVHDAREGGRLSRLGTVWDGGHVYWEDAMRGELQ